MPAGGDSHRILEAVDPDEIHDLICIGFGPASLAIAIALQDALEDAGENPFKPKVCFLERQHEFRWHAGMMLPDAKMQISFLKDMATQRNPRSRFTFLNYLKVKKRLVQFTNLGTFLPSRLEFADYMKWCSSAFEEVVQYGSEVIQIDPAKSPEEAMKYDLLSVQSRHGGPNGNIVTRRTRNIIIAIGGRPHIPPVLPSDNPRVIHSSTYASQINDLLKDREKAYDIGVLGSGQSAAEVFHDLHSRYPNAHTSLIFRDNALRPSDDSPFVNEIFDDDRITPFYEQPPAARAAEITSNKSTNYSVVRQELLEKLYHTLYQQRILEPDPQKWKARLYPSTEVVELIDNPTNKRINKLINVILKHTGASSTTNSHTTLDLDLLIYATGYTRDTHNALLSNCQILNASASSNGTWVVNRDYSVKLNSNFAAENLGIYLQGCNESTHGLSDTLISVLATRGGEVVERILGGELRRNGDGGVRGNREGDDEGDVMVW
jgi:L-ornithine N5-oxygenase